MTLDDLTLDVAQEIEINAAPGDVYRSLMKRLAEENTTPDGKPMQLVLEPWPGGRWFRDLGNGQGHLWGFVQVIKPPTLIELTGPLFMSYPAAGHIQFRVTQVAGGSLLAMRHRVLGMIDEDHRRGVTTGWQHLLESIKQSAEQ